MQPKRPSSARTSKTTGSVRFSSARAPTPTSRSATPSNNTGTFRVTRTNSAMTKQHQKAVPSAAERESQKAEQLLSMIRTTQQEQATKGPHYAHGVLKDPTVPQIDPMTADSLLRVKKLIRDVDDTLELQKREEQDDAASRLNLDDMMSSRELLEVKALEMAQKANSFWSGVPAVEMREMERQLEAKKAKLRAKGIQLEGDNEELGNAKSGDASSSAADGSVDLERPASISPTQDGAEAAQVRISHGVTGAYMVQGAPTGVEEGSDASDSGSNASISNSRRPSTLNLKSGNHVQSMDVAIKKQRAKDFFEVGAPRERTMKEQQEEEDRRAAKHEKHKLALTVAKEEEKRLQSVIQAFSKNSNEFSAAVAEVNLILTRCKSLAEMLMHERESMCYTLLDHFGIREQSNGEKDLLAASDDGRDVDVEDLDITVRDDDLAEGVSPLAARSLRTTLAVIDSHTCELRKALAQCTSAIKRLDEEVSVRDDSVAALEAKVRVANEALLSSNLERDEYKREMWAYRVTTKLRNLVRTRHSKHTALFGDSHSPKLLNNSSKDGFGAAGEKALSGSTQQQQSAPSILMSPSRASSAFGDSNGPNPGNSLLLGAVPNGVNVQDYDVVMASIVHISIHKYAELWDNYPAAMPAAIELFCEAIGRSLLHFEGAVNLYRSHGSTNFAGDGGYHMLMFRSPQDAANFTIGLQYLLNYLPWPEALLENVESTTTAMSEFPCGSIHYDHEKAISDATQASGRDPLTGKSDAMELLMKYCEDFGTGAGGGSVFKGFDFAPFKDTALRMIKKAKSAIGTRAATLLQQSLQSSTSSSSIYTRPLMHRGLRLKAGIHHGMVFVEGSLAHVQVGGGADDSFEDDERRNQGPPHAYGEALMVASMLCGAARGGEVLCSTAVQKALSTEFYGSGNSTSAHNFGAAGDDGKEFGSVSQIETYLKSTGVFCRPVPCKPSLILPAPPSNIRQQGLPTGVGISNGLLFSGGDTEHTPGQLNESGGHGDFGFRADFGMMPTGTSSSNSAGNKDATPTFRKHFGFEELFHGEELVFQLFPPNLFRRALLLGELIPVQTIKKKERLPQITDYNVNWYLRFNPAPSLPVCLSSQHAQRQMILAEKTSKRKASTQSSTIEFMEDSDLVLSDQDNDELLDTEDRDLLDADPTRHGGSTTYVTPGEEVALVSAHLRYSHLLNASLRRKAIRFAKKLSVLRQIVSTKEMEAMESRDMSQLRHAAGVLRTASVRSGKTLFEHFALLAAKHAAQDVSNIALCPSPTKSQAFHYTGTELSSNTTDTPNFSFGAQLGLNLMMDLSMTVKTIRDDLEPASQAPPSSTKKSAGVARRAKLTKTASFEDSHAFSASILDPALLLPHTAWFANVNTPQLLGNDLLSMLYEQSQRDAAEHGWCASGKKVSIDQQSASPGGTSSTTAAGSPSSTKSTKRGRKGSIGSVTEAVDVEDAASCHIYPYVSLFYLIVDLMLSTFESLDDCITKGRGVTSGTATPMEDRKPAGSSTAGLNLEKLRLALQRLQYIDALCGDGTLADPKDKRTQAAMVMKPEFMKASRLPGDVEEYHLERDHSPEETDNTGEDKEGQEATDNSRCSAAIVIERCHAALETLRRFATFSRVHLDRIVAEGSPMSEGNVLHDADLVSAYALLGSAAFTTWWNAHLGAVTQSASVRASLAKRFTNTGAVLSHKGTLRSSQYSRGKTSRTPPPPGVSPPTSRLGTPQTTSLYAGAQLSGGLPPSGAPNGTPDPAGVGSQLSLMARDIVGQLLTD